VGLEPVQPARVRSGIGRALRTVRFLLGALFLGPALVAATAAGQACSLPHFGAPARIYSPVSASPAAGPLVLLPADFDGDGHADVATVDAATNAVVILFGDGHGRFESKTFTPGGSLLAADFDGNGRLDLLVFRSGEMQVVFVGPGRTLVPGPITSTSGVLGLSASGDFDGDGHVDVAVSRLSTLVLFFGNGSGAFDGPHVATLPPPYWASRLEAADFDGDGKAEIAAIALERRHLSTLVRWNGSSLDLVTLFGGGQETYAVAVGDVNGDGLPDLLLGGRYPIGGALVIYRGDRDQGIVGSSTGLSDISSAVYRLAIADFDGNETPDLVAFDGSGQRTVFLGDGHGVFSPSTTTYAPYRVATLAPLTLDGDPGASSFVTQRDDGAVDLWPNRCPASDLILPALLSLSGVGGVRFESQLTLTNRGKAPISLAVVYTSAIGSGSGTGAFTLPPGQKTFASAFDFLRSAGVPIPAGADGLGTLGILVTTGSPTDVAALVRTTSQAPGAGRGGVAYAGIPLSQAAEGAAWVPWLREDSQDRANVAAVHAGGPSDGPITLRLTVRSGDPTHPGVAVLEDVTLVPGGFHQWDRALALSGLQATRGYARIERVSGKGRFVAYGIVNDNGTGDGSFVPAVTDEELSVARGALVVPAIVETGRFSTELVVTNVSDTERTLEASWKSELITTPDLTARFTLIVPASGQLDIADLVQHMRKKGVAGIPPRGGDIAGALILRATDGDAASILIGARMYTTESPGRYGVFTPAIASSASASYQASLIGLREDAEVRSNLAIVNTDSAPASFYVELSGAGGEYLGLFRIAVDAGRWIQIDRVLERYAPEATEAFASISGGPSFLAYAVLNDGAEPGLGTGDGTYVSMQNW
jgi:hypothetical protein